MVHEPLDLVDRPLVRRPDHQATGVVRRQPAGVVVLDREDDLGTLPDLGGEDGEAT